MAEITGHTSDKIWEAVESAIDDGVEPKAFVGHVREAWRDVLNERQRSVDKQFSRLLRPSIS